MTDIPIFSKDGEQVDVLTINDTIEYVNGRVCKGEKSYYKGVGVPYKSHNILNHQLTDEYTVVDEGLVFYSGSMVQKHCFVGKEGIFEERYGCVFPDWIGACSSREIQMFENLYDENRFEKTDIECLGWGYINEKAGQVYIECTFESDRKSWMETQDLMGLMDLINYMAQSDWNFPWDKSAVNDISAKSLVTDVADIFYSKELKHKLGSVYSVLYSLGMQSPALWTRFCVQHGLPGASIMDYVLGSIMILMRNGVDVSELMVGDEVTIYKNAVKNYLVVGKNCGYCGVGSCKGRMDDNLGYGDGIKAQYIDKAEVMLSK